MRTCKATSKTQSSLNLNSYWLVTFVHLLFSVQSLHIFLASCVFMTEAHVVLQGGTLSKVEVQTR